MPPQITTLPSGPQSRLPWANLLLAILFFLGCAGPPVLAAPLIDDRAITLKSPRDIAERRRELIQFIWGKDGWPKSNRPSVVRTNVPSPVRHLTHLARVDELRFALSQGTPALENLAYHFIPAQPNGELVIVHHGHACTFDDDPSPTNNIGYGLQRTIHGLLREGYGVLAVYMPRQRPGDCGGSHDALYQLPTPGNPMRFFLEPVAISLNYLQARRQRRADRFPRYRTFHMTGLSGGGWTTTVYAAIDPTIQCSVPIAGTLPLYLRTGGSIGDREQFDPAFYKIAGYPDLYVLGAAGRDRRQVQVLVRRDDCCFGQAQHGSGPEGHNYEEALRDYANRVTARVDELGAGEFRLNIDEHAPSHMISHQTIQQILLPALRLRKETVRP
jgi:hypothetical protein